MKRIYDLYIEQNIICRNCGNGFDGWIWVFGNVIECSKCTFEYAVSSPLIMYFVDRHEGTSFVGFALN